MKRKLFNMTALLAVLLAMGIGLAGCDTGTGGSGTSGTGGSGTSGGGTSGGGGSSNPFGGTWRGTAADGQRLTLTITDTTWEYDSNSLVYDYNVRYSVKGTYTYSGNAGTMTVTHFKFTDEEWRSAQGYMPATIVGNTLTVTSLSSMSEDSTTATFTKDGSVSNSISGTWSKGSGSDEKTLIISLTTGEWSSDATVWDGKNIGGIFMLTSETAGSLKTGSSNFPEPITGNALLSGGTLYITGFDGRVAPPVNGTYTKKNDYDDVGEYAVFYS